jgi:hypothetical protein
MTTLQPYMGGLAGRARMADFIHSPAGYEYLAWLAGETREPRDQVNFITSLGSISQGETYVVEPQVHALIRAAGEALPLDLPIAPSIIPAARGFIWLDPPLEDHWTIMPPGQRVAINAITWGITTNMEDHDSGSDLGSVKAGEITIGFRSTAPSPEIATNIVIGFFCTFPGAPRDPYHGIPHLAFAASLVPGHSLQQLQDDDPDTSFLTGLRYAMAFLLFIQQRLTAVEKHRPTPESCRRLTRARRLGLLRDVSVVVLRKRDKAEVAGDPHPVDWSCQWLVRGHWRRQYYPRTDRHETIWIAPYRKGPEDKPLREPRADLFLVAR